MGFPDGSAVKNLPIVQETQVQSLGPEDPLEEDTATHPGILAWKITWTEEPGSLWSIGSPRLDKTEHTAPLGYPGDKWARTPCHWEIHLRGLGGLQPLWGRPFCVGPEFLTQEAGTSSLSPSAPCWQSRKPLPTRRCQ